MIFIGRAQPLSSYRRMRNKTNIHSCVIVKEERGHSTSKVALMYPIIAHDKYVQNLMINA